MIQLRITVLLICLLFSLSLGFNSWRSGEVTAQAPASPQPPHIPPSDFSALLYSLQDIEAAQEADGLRLLPWFYQWNTNTNS